jgi:hypothetical protein
MVTGTALAVKQKMRLGWKPAYSAESFPAAPRISTPKDIARKPVAQGSPKDPSKDTLLSA